MEFKGLKRELSKVKVNLTNMIRVDSKGRLTNNGMVKETGDNSPTQTPPKLACESCNAQKTLKMPEYFCSDCNRYLCTDCATLHKLHSETNHHRVIPQKNERGQELCTKHQEVLLFLCEDEKTMCCIKCISESHRNCKNVVEVEDIGSIGFPAFEELKQELLDLGAEASKIVLRVKRQRRQFSADTGEVLKNLQQMQDAVREMFESIKEEASQEINAFRKQAFGEFDSKQASCKACVSTAEKLLAEIQDVTDKGSLTQKVISARRIKEDVKELEAKLEAEYQTLRDIVVKFDFYESLELPPSPSAKLGKLSIQVVEPSELNELAHESEGEKQNMEETTNTEKSHNIKPKFFFDEPDENLDLEENSDESVSPQLEPTVIRKQPDMHRSQSVEERTNVKANILLTPEVPSRPLETISELKLLKSIELRRNKSNLNEPLYTGISFLSDGRLVAVDNKNDKCHVFNQQLQTIGHLNLPFKPQDIAITNADEIVVTTGIEFILEFLFVSGTNKIFRVRSVSKQGGQYSSICTFGDGKLLLGTIDDVKPLRIMTTEGADENLSIDLPEQKYAVGQSACSFIPSLNKIVFTDRLANTVFIYDIGTGEKIEVKDEQVIVEPRGVAVGPSDTVYVCSSATNSIVKISPEGEILGSKELDILYPCRISVSKDRKRLAVSNACAGAKKLQLYEIGEVEEPLVVSL